MIFRKGWVGFCGVRGSGFVRVSLEMEGGGICKV
jgi:hypothetical protein